MGRARVVCDSCQEVFDVRLDRKCTIDEDGVILCGQCSDFAVCITCRVEPCQCDPSGGALRVFLGEEEDDELQ